MATDAEEVRTSREGVQRGHTVMERGPALGPAPSRHHSSPWTQARSLTAPRVASSRPGLVAGGLPGQAPVHFGRDPVIGAPPPPGGLPGSRPQREAGEERPWSRWPWLPALPGSPSSGPAAVCDAAGPSMTPDGRTAPLPASSFPPPTAPLKARPCLSQGSNEIASGTELRDPGLHKDRQRVGVGLAAPGGTEPGGGRPRAGPSVLMPLEPRGRHPTHPPSESASLMREVEDDVPRCSAPTPVSLASGHLPPLDAGGGPRGRGRESGVNPPDSSSELGPQEPGAGDFPHSPSSISKGVSGPGEVHLEGGQKGTHKTPPSLGDGDGDLGVSPAQGRPPHTIGLDLGWGLQPGEQSQKQALMGEPPSPPVLRSRNPCLRGVCD
ncbi:translation initiation factor IF-2-like [Choloepus didactylus]|uniref:translation initiation factor IF-2-like n=1 Tax=Choloepus didactylus TaxID=27675 RepID=UPI00189FF26B|nr:translation initiation factor IF-2-like [Choloepus didactylus]